LLQTGRVVGTCATTMANRSRQSELPANERTAWRMSNGGRLIVCMQKKQQTVGKQIASKTGQTPGKCGQNKRFDRRKTS